MNKPTANIDTDNREFQNALRLITDTNQSVFLTGKAGTGKSTFLKHICEVTHKKFIVLAPTGIAAVNVGGMTMHSFFKMPLKPLIPDDPDYSPRNIRKTLRYPKEKVKIIKQLDLIIIDEISMVRADMIDFMDRVLRIYNENMREPFGGKQLLFVGDIFQLEPVVTPDMRDILRHYYPGFFFFNARAFSQVRLVPIELRKIYRQTDSAFISLLDKIRINQASERDIQVVNSRFSQQYSLHSTSDFVMTLASRRDTVDTINESHLAELSTEERTFTGIIDGTFPLQNLPTSQELTLKVGAQVIFIRNDRMQRWINGTLGKIAAFGDDFIVVETEDGHSYSLEPEQWENMQYDYDEREKRIKETVLGTFTQFPVKLAWALTIHKSQGLTFNNIVIDLAGGAFSSGQTYVALSRCTSLQGITLRQPISLRDIIVNPAVVNFSRSFNDNRLIADALQRANALRLFAEAAQLFNAGDFGSAISRFAEANVVLPMLSDATTQRLLRRKLSQINTLSDHIDCLNRQIEEQRATIEELAGEFAALGTSLLHSDDPISRRSAIANFDKALRLAPGCIEALAGKATVAQQLGNNDEAAKLLDEAAKLAPKQWELLLRLGKLKHAMRNYPTALITLKKALRLCKTNPEIHDSLADVYDRIGLTDQATHHRELALKLRQKK